MANLKNGTLNYFLTKDLDALENRENALKEMNKMDPTYPDPNDPRFTDPAPVFTIQDNQLYRDGVAIGKIYNNKTGRIVKIDTLTEDSFSYKDTSETAIISRDISVTTVSKLTGLKNIYIPPYQGFCKLTLSNGDIIELEGSGKLTNAMTKPYKATCVSAEIGKLCTSIDYEAFSDGYFDGYPLLTSVVISDSVISIGDYAFDYCTSLSSVTFGIGVNSIGMYAFCKCPITSLIIPNATFIGYDAFDNCTSLVSVTLPNIITIDNLAFAYCTKLESVTLGNSITSIGYESFKGTPWWNTYSVDPNNHYGNIIYINKVAYKATSVNIENCTFKNDTLSIGDQAFERCEGLTSVIIPKTVTYIGTRAFNQCSSLTLVKLPDNITELNQYVFNYCTSLTSVGTIGSGASVEIPSSITKIGRGAFSGCSGLTNVSIPNNVTVIDAQTFQRCSSLVSVNLPNNLTKVDTDIFAYCSSLTSIVIPSNVTELGYRTFQYCSNLESITCNAIIAPIIKSAETFQGVKTDGTLTVPTGATGYDTWMSTSNYYLGKYNWTKVEQS